MAQFEHAERFASDLLDWQAPELSSVIALDYGSTSAVTPPAKGAHSSYQSEGKSLSGSQFMPQPQKPPSQLADALARVAQAKANYVAFANEIQVFLYEYVGGMIKRPEGDDFAIQFRHPKESEVSGPPKVLVGQIVENLRSALDYMVFELSALNDPALNQRTPQFVIAVDESSFQRQAQRRLRYLSDEQKTLIEKIQPYHGNPVLGLLGEMAGAGKHRRLLTIRDNTGLQIYFAEMEKQAQYEDCFAYPVGKGSAVFARPEGRPTVLLMDKYDATGLLKSMIEHVADIIRISFCFFEDRPLKMTILRS